MTETDKEVIDKEKSTWEDIVYYTITAFIIIYTCSMCIFVHTKKDKPLLTIFIFVVLMCSICINVVLYKYNESILLPYLLYGVNCTFNIITMLLLYSDYTLKWIISSHFIIYIVILSSFFF